jgi:hypothetical protein
MKTQVDISIAATDENLIAGSYSLLGDRSTFSDQTPGTKN